MTTARGSTVALLLTFVAVVVGLLTAFATASSAAPLLHPQTRVAAIATPESQLVGLNETVLPGGSRPRAPDYDRSATGSSVAAEGGAGSSSVNPLNGTNNCVNCAIAGDATLAGARASALDSATPQPLSILEGAFGNSFQPVSGQAQIEQDLLASGSGSRGIVFGSRGLQAGRVFNAVNQGGVIRFIDFQSGGAASFQGYQGYYFLRTTP